MQNIVEKNIKKIYNNYDQCNKLIIVIFLHIGGFYEKQV